MTKTKKKLTGKDFVMLRCPTCRTKYYRLRSALGQKELCGACVSTVVLEHIPLSTGKSSPKKQRAR